LKGFQIGILDEIKFFNEEDEMLETRVQVCISAETFYLVKVDMIYVGIYSEHPFVHHLDLLHKSVWKSCSRFNRKECGVGYLFTSLK